MPLTDPTYIGQVASVTGAVVRVRLRDDMPSTLVMIGGESYRIGQVGGFVRLPLGYANLYAVCTQIGADAAPGGGLDIPPGGGELEADSQLKLSGFRWMTVVLFGEGLGSQFERGVSQYPTIGDEVHLVTNEDLKVIYGWSAAGGKGTICVGQIAATSGISADISVGGLVSRHCAVVGSTGAGKSNLVTVLLESVSDGSFPSARTIVIDPHGEYASALGDKAKVFKIGPNFGPDEKPLWVPFWALPFSELQELTLGGLQPQHEAAIRELVLDLKSEAAQQLAVPVPIETLTADSPVPFSLNRLWYELDKFERMTFSVASGQTAANANPPTVVGDPNALKSDEYPPASPYNQAPYKNQRKRNIERSLDLMRSRLRDGRFAFLFNPGDGYMPETDGKIVKDLDSLVQGWVGHDRPISVFDVSGLPSEILPTVVGTMLRVIYDMLFWASDLPVSGRNQPLLIVLDEAHRFAPEGSDTPAHRTLSTIAKEGRKYGTGLMLVTQRPSEISSSVLSQCGSIVALRITNTADRSKVAASVPDDLGGLVDQLPSLRTGEGVFLGEIMPIPSRVRVRKARNKPVGDDPVLPNAWQGPHRPDPALYVEALLKWRAQSTSAESQAGDQNQQEAGDA